MSGSKSNKRVVTEQTIIGSACIPLWVFAIQRGLQGDIYVGGAAAGIAIALFASYEYLGLKNFPINQETLREASEEVGERVEDVVDDRNEGE